MTVIHKKSHEHHIAGSRFYRAFCSPGKEISYPDIAFPKKIIRRHRTAHDTVSPLGWDWDGGTNQSYCADDDEIVTCKSCLRRLKVFKKNM